MTASEEAVIRAWLLYIHEDDPAVIGKVWALVESNQVEKARLLEFARKALRLVFDNDDRRYCDQCIKLAASGRCLAALRGAILASPNFEPTLDLPHRCAGYLPGPGDPDQRRG